MGSKSSVVQRALYLKIVETHIVVRVASATAAGVNEESQRNEVHRRHKQHASILPLDFVYPQIVHYLVNAGDPLQRGVVAAHRLGVEILEGCFYFGDVTKNLGHLCSRAGRHRIPARKMRVFGARGLRVGS